MVCSPAQLAANRRNAARSTGPKTPAGKERSRGNALKHGLTGAGVAVPDEDQAAIAERIEAFQADLKPKDAVALYLVRRVALLSVRLDRSARHESAEITRAMTGALDKEDEERAEEVDRLMAALPGDPSLALRKLRRTPEGLDRLIRTWQGLKADLDDDRFVRASVDLVMQLLGRKAQLYRGTRVHKLFEAYDKAHRHLALEEWPGVEPLDRVRIARDELKASFEVEIGRLEADRAALDHEALAKSRALAPARALFDPSPEAILARRYEAAAEREFHRSLKLIQQLDDRGPSEGPPVEADANSSEEVVSGESASFFPADPAESKGLGRRASARLQPPDSTPRSSRISPKDLPERASKSEILSETSRR